MEGGDGYMLELQGVLRKLVLHCPVGSGSQSS